MSLRRELWRAWLTSMAVLSFVGAALAHDVRGTVVLLDVGAQQIGVELQLPVPELRAALKLPRQASALDAVALAPASELRAYIRRHFAAIGAEGQSFALDIRDVGIEQVDDGECIVAHATLRAPATASTRRFDLHADLIVHEVVSHNLYVFVRRDLARGLVDKPPELLGMMHFQNRVLPIDRGDGSVWRGLSATFRLGLRHIAEGSDHLMFLLVLLLPAVLRRGRTRWAGRTTARQGLVRIAKVVTAFTLGHSLTLLIGTMAAQIVSARAVEVAIALSIVVSSVHAIVPLFAGYELWLAAGFGLLHGLAFASALSGLALDLPTLLLSVFGFNLGIEAMQLLVILVTMPWLFLLSRSAMYGPLRIALALIAGLMALALAAERAFELANPLSAGFTYVAAYGVWGIVVLALLATSARFLPLARVSD